MYVRIFMFNILIFRIDKKIKFLNCSFHFFNRINKFRFFSMRYILNYYKKHVA